MINNVRVLIKSFAKSSEINYSSRYLDTDLDLQDWITFMIKTGEKDIHNYIVGVTYRITDKLSFTVDNVNVDCERPTIRIEYNADPKNEFSILEYTYIWWAYLDDMIFDPDKFEFIELATDKLSYSSLSLHERKFFEAVGIVRTNGIAL